MYTIYIERERGRFPKSWLYHQEDEEKSHFSQPQITSYKFHLNPLLPESVE